MLRYSILLLLPCLVNHSETPSVEARSNSVEVKKGGNIILQCELENNTIIHLNRWGKRILDCQNGTCENKTENVQRICKEGVCDIIIKNLSFSDAGKYILRFWHANNQTEKVQEKTYRLQIQDEVCVKIGEKLKLDVLLPNAHKVEHQNKTSSVWTVVWNTSERLTDTDGNLSINNVTASDAGSYRVLEYNVSKAVILISVTVTECKTESKEGLDGAEQHAEEKWSLPFGVCFGIVLLVVIVITVLKMRHRRRGYIQGRLQNNPDPQNL